MTPKILVIPGSARKDSVNKKLARVAAAAVKMAGGEATFLDLHELPLPLYDGDLESEQGLPENAKKLKKLMNEHHGLLFVSPEYNSSIPPVLKNLIDWASRKDDPSEEDLVCFKGKVALLMGASPSFMGGMRALVHLRSILGNINVLVLPDQKTLPNAYDAFNPDGSLKEAKHQESIARMAEKFVKTIQKLLSA